MPVSKTLSFPIENLSCASCVGRAQKALETVPGLSDVSVNLATETAQVTTDLENPAPLIAQTLQTAGYPATSAELTLAIEGMTCASCVGHVQKALSNVQGVLEASVNLATETGTVRYISGATNRAELVKAVEGAGYSVRHEAETRPQQDDRKEKELADLSRQTLLAAFLALPVFIIEMGSHLIPAMHSLVMNTIGMDNSRLLQFVLTTAVLLGPGRRFFQRGIPALLKRTPDMNSLVALGTSAAYGFSVVATFWPALLPQGTANVYYEAAAVIIVLILLGRLLEARAKGRTGQAIRKLARLQPKTALVERNGTPTQLPIEDIRTNDVIHVLPGQQIPTDGDVLTGHSYVDESMITGEPVPVEKSSPAPVVGGTINGTGTLTFKATKTGSDTTLAQIIRMVEQAQGAKLPIQGLVDKITAWFVPVVMAIAAATVLAWLLFGPTPTLGHALVAGVSVLIIACPCAMGLATPTSIMVGTGRAAELGVLFRKGDALQSLQNTTIIALDKTGTLTQGRPEMTDFTAANGFDADESLRLIAAVEATSEHPIAQAITRAAKDKNLTLPNVENFTSQTGYGVQADVEGHNLLIGADRFMTAQNIDITAQKKTGDALGASGKTPLYAAIDGRLAAIIAVADPIKPSTPAAISALRARGLKVAMITGDNQGTADAIAAQLGIDTVVAEVLPEGKIAALKALKSRSDTLAFVGDGINDAPALATADIGIAIGTGTDVAVEAADVVLMSGDLQAVVNAFEISAATMKNIRENLFWAFGYNALLIPVAAGVLYPFAGVLLSPVLAAGAMSLSSVFVLSNALRLRWVKAPRPQTSAMAPHPKLMQKAHP